MRSLYFALLFATTFCFNAQAQFVQMYNGQFNESATCVAVDASNNTIVGINFQNTVNADPFGTIQLTAYGDETDLGLIKYNAFGQVIWAKRIGGEFTSEKPYAVETDAARNIYIVGHFGNDLVGGTVAGNFDPDNTLDTVGTIGREDGFLARYDSSGAFDWVVRFGNLEINTNERTFDLAVDASGNAYVCGAFQGMMDFNPKGEPNVQFSPDSTISTYVAKYDTGGFCMWAVVINSGCENVVECFCSLDLSPDNDLVVAGNFRGASVNVDPQNFGMPLFNGLGETDIFISKYNSTNGIAQWAHAFATNESESVLPGSMRVDANNSIYLTGKLSGNNVVNFATGPSPFTVSNSSLFLTKFNASGETQWAKGFESFDGDGGKTISFDFDNNVYIGGSMNDSINFGNGVTRFAHSTTADALIAKFNSTGSCQWAFNFGGNNTPNTTGNSWVNALAIDQQENFLVAGELFGEMADIDPVDSMFLTSQGANDGYIFKLTKLGALWPDTNDLTVEPTGIRNFVFNDFSFYPNPVSTRLNIEMHELSTKPLTAEIFDSFGRLCFVRTINDKQTFIATELLRTGCYFIKITDSNRVVAKHAFVKL